MIQFFVYSCWMVLPTKLKLFIEDLKISYTPPYVGFTHSQNRLRQSVILTKTNNRNMKTNWIFFPFAFLSLVYYHRQWIIKQITWFILFSEFLLFILLKCDALKSDSLNQLRLIEFPFSHRVNKFYCMMIKRGYLWKINSFPLHWILSDCK